MVGLVFLSIAVVSMASIMYYLIDHEWEIPAEYVFFTLGCVANTVMTWLYNLFQSESTKHLYSYAYTTIIKVKLHLSWPWFKNFEKRASEVGVLQVTIDAIRNLQGGENFDKPSFRWNGDLLFDVNKFFISPMMEVYMEVQKNDKMTPFMKQIIFVKVLWLYIHFKQNVLDKPTDGIKAIIRYITIYVCLNSSERYTYFDEAIIDSVKNITNKLNGYGNGTGLITLYNKFKNQVLFSGDRFRPQHVELYEEHFKMFFENFKLNQTTVNNVFMSCKDVSINSRNEYKHIKFS